MSLPMELGRNDHAGDTGLIPGSGRSPGRGNGNPLKYSFLENPMDRGAWRATVHGVTKESDTIERLCTHTHHTNTIVINSLKSIGNSEILDNLGSDDF